EAALQSAILMLTIEGPSNAEAAAVGRRLQQMALTTSAKTSAAAVNTGTASNTADLLDRMLCTPQPLQPPPPPRPPPPPMLGAHQHQQPQQPQQQNRWLTSTIAHATVGPADRGVSTPEAVSNSSSGVSLSLPPAAASVCKQQQQQTSLEREWSRRISAGLCPHCDAPAATDEQRHFHERVHAMDELYRCQLCACRFAYPCSLRMHNNLHANRSLFLQQQQQHRQQQQQQQQQQHYPEQQDLVPQQIASYQQQQQQQYAAAGGKMTLPASHQQQQQQQSLMWDRTVKRTDTPIGPVEGSVQEGHQPPVACDCVHDAPLDSGDCNSSYRMTKCRSSRGCCENSNRINDDPPAAPDDNANLHRVLRLRGGDSNVTASPRQTRSSKKRGRGHRSGSELQVLQFNCNGLQARRTELAARLARTQPVAVLLQETKLRPGAAIHPPQGYHVAAREDGEAKHDPQPVATANTTQGSNDGMPAGEEAPTTRRLTRPRCRLRWPQDKTGWCNGCRSGRSACSNRNLVACPI
ncbi:hypothetical protein BOX15_Mlig030259g1, partial [Macrostomum lignano]